MVASQHQRLLGGLSDPKRNGALRQWFGARHVRLLLSLCFVGAICFLFSASYTNQIFGFDGATLLLNGSDPLLYSCRPKTHVYFMKTHKCASSSLQNIFLRYGDKHNLTFALPQNTNYFGHPAPFNRSMLPPPLHPVTYSIFAMHTRFNRGEAYRMMPQDTVYITILRDPVTLFESMYSYYNLENQYKLQLPQLLRKHPNPLDPIYNNRRYGKFGLNQMAFDLGLNQNVARREAAVDRFIELLDETFDLVLISERMPESLVLLRYLLCWQVDDLIVFKKNARSTSYKQNEQSLTEADINTLKVLNAADQKIYDHFNKKLSEKIEFFGQRRMDEEKAIVNERTKYWYDECVSEERNADRDAIKEKKLYSNKVLYFESREHADPECKRIIREELAYVAILRERQSSYINYNKTQTTPRQSRPRL